jgi:hypothetical protein
MLKIAVCLVLTILIVGCSSYTPVVYTGDKYNKLPQKERVYNRDGHYQGYIEKRGGTE